MERAIARSVPKLFSIYLHKVLDIPIRIWSNVYVVRRSVMTNEELVRLVRLLLEVWEERGQEAAEALLAAAQEN